MGERKGKRTDNSSYRQPSPGQFVVANRSYAKQLATASYGDQGRRLPKPIDLDEADLEPVTNNPADPTP